MLEFFAVVLIEKGQKFSAFGWFGACVFLDEFFGAEEVLVVSVGDICQFQLQFLALDALFLNHLLAETQLVVHL